MSELVIIEAAINGATSKTVNPNVPVTEDEIVAVNTRRPDRGGASTP
jgi:uncharacterized protein (DUF849 family)